MKRRIAPPGAGLVLLGLLACDGDATLHMGAHTPFAGCEGAPTPPPAALAVAPFYGKYLDANGVPVLSSTLVSDEALRQACRIAGNTLALRADLRGALATIGHRVVVMAESERTTDIPEYADLGTVFPETDWNSYRAISATRVRPLSSTSEENLRCLPGDLYTGESSLVWTLAHGIHDLAMPTIDPGFPAALQAAYDEAMANGRWAKTAATKGPEDYWVVGTLAWFGASTRLPVDTPAALGNYDPPLAALLARYLPATGWRPSCYGG